MDNGRSADISKSEDAKKPLSLVFCLILVFLFLCLIAWLMFPSQKEMVYVYYKGGRVEEFIQEAKKMLAVEKDWELHRKLVKVLIRIRHPKAILEGFLYLEEKMDKSILDELIEMTQNDSSPDFETLCDLGVKNFHQELYLLKKSWWQAKYKPEERQKTLIEIWRISKNTNVLHDLYALGEKKFATKELYEAREFLNKEDQKRLFWYLVWEGSREKVHEFLSATPWDFLTHEELEIALSHARFFHDSEMEIKVLLKMIETSPQKQKWQEILARSYDYFGYPEEAVMVYEALYTQTANPVYLEQKINILQMIETEDKLFVDYKRILKHNFSESAFSFCSRYLLSRGMESSLQEEIIFLVPTAVKELQKGNSQPFVQMIKTWKKMSLANGTQQLQEKILEYLDEKTFSGNMDIFSELDLQNRRFLEPYMKWLSKNPDPVLFQKAAKLYSPNEARSMFLSVFGGLTARNFDLWIHFVDPAQEEKILLEESIKTKDRALLHRMFRRAVDLGFKKVYFQILMQMDALGFKDAQMEKLHGDFLSWDQREEEAFLYWFKAFQKGMHQDVSIRFALARWYEKKNEIDHAKEHWRWLSKKASIQEHKEIRIQALAKTNNFSEALALISDQDQNHPTLVLLKIDLLKKTGKDPYPYLDSLSEEMKKNPWIAMELLFENAKKRQITKEDINHFLQSITSLSESDQRDLLSQAARICFDQKNLLMAENLYKNALSKKGGFGEKNIETEGIGIYLLKGRESLFRQIVQLPGITHNLFLAQKAMRVFSDLFLFDEILLFHKTLSGLVAESPEIFPFLFRAHLGKKNISLVLKLAKHKNFSLLKPQMQQEFSFEIAILLKDMDREEAANFWFLQVLKNQNEDFLSRHRKAFSLWMLQKFEKAAAIYQALCLEDRENISVQAEYLDLLIQMKRHQDVLFRIGNLSPGISYHTRIQTVKASALTALRAFRNSEMILKTLIEKTEFSHNLKHLSDLWVQRGSNFEQWGRISQAHLCYRKAMELSRSPEIEREILRISSLIANRVAVKRSQGPVFDFTQVEILHQISTQMKLGLNFQKSRDFTRWFFSFSDPNWIQYKFEVGEEHLKLEKFSRLFNFLFERTRFTDALFAMEEKLDRTRVNIEKKSSPQTDFWAMNLHLDSYENLYHDSVYSELSLDLYRPFVLNQKKTRSIGIHISKELESVRNTQVAFQAYQGITLQEEQIFRLFNLQSWLYYGVFSDFHSILPTFGIRLKNRNGLFFTADFFYDRFLDTMESSFHFGMEYNY